MNWKDFRTSIFINTSFEAVHTYKDAPEVVKYLRYPHRHIFEVSLDIEVFHDDREIEFIILKSDINRFLQLKYGSKDIGGKSCEMIAKEIVEHVCKSVTDTDEMKPRAITCIVSEDGENGAIVEGVYQPWE